MVAVHAAGNSAGLLPDRRGFGETGVCQLHFCSSIWAVIFHIVFSSLFCVAKRSPKFQAPNCSSANFKPQANFQVFLAVRPGKEFPTKIVPWCTRVYVECMYIVAKWVLKRTDTGGPHACFSVFLSCICDGLIST